MTETESVQPVAIPGEVPRSTGTLRRVTLVLLATLIGTGVGCDPTSNSWSLFFHTCVLRRTMPEIMEDRSPRELVKLMGDTELLISHAAIGKLLEQGDVDAMLGATTDQNPIARQFAVKWLVEFAPDSRIVPAVRAALDDREWRIRCAAARSLALIGEPADIDLLQPLLEDEHERVREVAVECIDELHQRFPTEFRR